MQNYMSFDHFTMNSWQYMSNFSARAWEAMSPQEKLEFNLDVTTIDWARAESNFMFGIRRFFLKEDVLPPEAHFKQLLAKDRVEYFHDVRTAFNMTRHVPHCSNSDFFSEILNDKRFNSFLEQKS